MGIIPAFQAFLIINNFFFKMKELRRLLTHYLFCGISQEILSPFIELSNAIDKILVNQEFDFDEFIYKTYSKENINKKVLELIK